MGQGSQLVNEQLMRGGKFQILTSVREESYVALLHWQLSGRDAPES